MSQAPSMPLYWDAYLADTTHLSTEEHGAYFLLLGAMWRRNGSVPDDDRDNARIVGLSVAKWRRIKARLAPFLTFEGDEISQKKLRETWEITQEKIEKNRQNGARGGRPVSKKSNGLGLANGSVSDNPNKKRNETIPEPDPEPEEKDPSGPKKKSGSKGARLSEDWALPDEWATWAMTELGVTRAFVRAEAEVFRDYWLGVAGQKGVKLDWQATWRNWMRRAASRNPGARGPAAVGQDTFQGLGIDSRPIQALPPGGM
jgi:uncharacterized protein YdaU (DUF1376 family)